MPSRTATYDRDAFRHWIVISSPCDTRETVLERDSDPSDWKPPNGSTHCVYSRRWIDVKCYYGLSLDSGEKTALQQMLGTC